MQPTQYPEYPNLVTFHGAWGWVARAKPESGEGDDLFRVVIKQVAPLTFEQLTEISAAINAAKEWSWSDESIT